MAAQMHSTGREGALHADGQARDDIGGGAGFRRFGHFPYRRAAGVVFGEKADQNAGETAQQDRPEHALGEAYAVHREIAAGEHDARGHERSVAEGGRGTEALQDLHRQHADQRRHQADGGHDERQLHGRQLHDLDVKYGTAGQRGYQRRRRRGRDGDGRHDGSDVRLEDVGPHPGHVAHVVAHEIGERRGVSRIVLGNAGLHLADEIGAHVGRFGIDSAAHACKEGNRTGAHRETR